MTHRVQDWQYGFKVDTKGSQLTTVLKTELSLWTAQCRVIGSKLDTYGSELTKWVRNWHKRFKVDKCTKNWTFIGSKLDTYGSVLTIWVYGFKVDTKGSKFTNVLKNELSLWTPLCRVIGSKLDTVTVKVHLFRNIWLN